MWTVASSASNYDVPTSGRRCRPVDLIVACVVIMVATSFVQGDLTMPDVQFEPCHRSSPSEEGTCPQYYYCSQRDSRCEPCSSCARPKDCEGSIAQCEKSTILEKSGTTYMASLRHDLSPSCDATELRENRLLSATCSRHCFDYNSSVLCFIGTECNASCSLPGIGRDGVWRWVSNCSCHRGDKNELVCNWTEPLPACTNATANIPSETAEGTRLMPQPLFPDVDTVTAAEDSAKKTATVMTPTEILAFVCAIIATSSAIAAIAVGLRLRRRVTSQGRQNIADEGTANDGQATVINNSVHHTNVLVAEVGHLSVGGRGGEAIGPPAMQRQGQGQHNRPTASCRRSGRHGPCRCRYGVASPIESKPSTTHAATVSDGVGGSLRCGKCRYLGCPGAPSTSHDCGIGSHSCTAYGDCSGEPDDEREDCDESGGCSSPLLQSKPEQAIQMPAADLSFCCGRPGHGADACCLEYAGAGGHSGDGSFYVEADAVPDDLPPPRVVNEARPGGGGDDWGSFTKPGIDATVDCSCCISGRCSTCSGDDDGGCRHDGNNCRDDLAEGEWPDSCESTNSSDRCSAEVARGRVGHSETSVGFLRSAAIVDPAPNARATPSQRSTERTVIKADCVGLLEIIPTADAALAGNIAADLELGNVGLLRVGLSTVVAAAPRH